MIRAKLKGLMCSNFDLRTYVPGDPSSFGFWVELEIGSEASSGADLFQVLVCTPQWLDAEMKDKGAMWHRSSVIVDSYDYPQFATFIERTINAIEGRSWPEVVAKLRLLANWEFEEYAGGPAAGKTRSMAAVPRTT